LVRPGDTNLTTIIKMDEVARDTETRKPHCHSVFENQETLARVCDCDVCGNAIMVLSGFALCRLDGVVLAPIP
jgi:hypothetical protein